MIERSSLLTLRGDDDEFGPPEKCNMSPPAFEDTDPEQLRSRSILRLEPPRFTCLEWTTQGQRLIQMKRNTDTMLFEIDKHLSASTKFHVATSTILPAFTFRWLAFIRFNSLLQKKCFTLVCFSMSNFHVLEPHL